MTLPRLVETRGGLLVGLVVLAVIGFEFRTVLGMLVGVEVAMGPYLIVMIALLSVAGVTIDVLRTTGTNR